MKLVAFILKDGMGMPKVRLTELSRTLSIAFDLGAGRGRCATGEVGENICVVSMRVSCLISSNNAYEP